MGLKMSLALTGSKYTEYDGLKSVVCVLYRQIVVIFF